MTNNSFAEQPVPLKSKADILQIMVGLAMEADRIGEPILSSFLLMGVQGAELPTGTRKRLVNIGHDLMRVFVPRAAVFALVVLGLGGSVACGATPSSPTAIEAPAPVSVVAAPAVPEVTAPSYSCAERDALVAAYFAAHPSFDTAIVTLDSGETVYIDWLRRVFHHSGPRCAE